MVIKVKRKWGFLEQISDSIDSYNQYATLTGKQLLEKLEVDGNGIPAYDRFEIQDGVLFKEPSKFVICIICESIHHLMNNLKLYPLDKHYLFITNGDWKKEDFKIPYSYNIAPWPYINIDAINMDKHNPAILNFWYDSLYSFTYPKKGSFVCLAGSKKSFRTDLMNKIMQSPDRFQNSLIRYEDKTLRDIPGIIDVVEDRTKFLSGIISGQENMQYIVPSAMFSQFNFNLVIETNAYDVEEFHPTEKTFKPLSVGMPFVIASSYRFLRNLRSMGFKTYDSLWSEEYDEIPDWDKRSEMILKLCEDLVNFNWESKRSELIEIAWHNLNTIRNMQSMLLNRITRFLDEARKLSIMHGTYNV